MGTTGQRLRAIFTQQVARIGTSVTLKRTTTAAYDPTITQSTTSQVSYTVRGVFESVNAFSKTGQRNESFLTTDGTDIRSQWKVFLIPPIDTLNSELGFIPSVGDSATIAGRDYQIRQVESETADDVVVFHRLYLEFA